MGGPGCGGGEGRLCEVPDGAFFDETGLGEHVVNDGVGIGLGGCEHIRVVKSDELEWGGAEVGVLGNEGVQRCCGQQVAGGWGRGPAWQEGEKGMRRERVAGWVVG